MSFYYKKERISNQKKALENQNPYYEYITLCLHDGTINNNGFISITLTPYNTEYSSGNAIKFKNLKELFKEIKEKNYHFDLKAIAKTYKSISKYRRDKKLPKGKDNKKQ